MKQVKKVLLLIEMSRGFGRDLITGISRYARFHGPWSSYTYPPFFRSSERNREILRNLKNKGIQGVISREMAEFDEIARLNVPVIFASTIKPKSLQIPDNIPIITCDNEIVGRMAAEHLVNCGFRHYAYCGYQNISWSAIREAAFRKRLNESGYPMSGYEQPRTPHRQKWEHEQSMLIKWLRALPKPVGIMACSDDRSRDLIEAAKLADIRIPEDVAVVGVDNDTLVCELSHPTLSSIALDSESAGYKAAELLDRLMDGAESMSGQKILIKPTIVEVRHSTDMLVVDDRDVFAAMSYIKNHAFEPMQVEEVVETTCICRRSLERRFQETIGRSIHAEICRVRVELIKKMLIETNMTQLQIAHAMGYVSIDNLRRFFHREVHTTPLAYRTKFRQA